MGSGHVQQYHRWATGVGVTASWRGIGTLRAVRTSGHGWSRITGAVIAILLLSSLLVPGCSNGVSIDVEGVEARWMSVPGPGDREALVVTAVDVPKAERRTRPLFVVLHGAGQNAVEMTTYGGWAVAARDNHAVAAFAQGLDDTFSAGTCCGASARRGVDDVGYLDRLIRTVTTKVGADPSKVYMVGFSNGAMMTYRYMCEGATRLSGAVSLAGTNAAGCTPQRQTAFLQVSGAADQTVPIGDTPSINEFELGPLVPVQQAVRELAAAWSCGPPQREVNGAVTTRTWVGCSEGGSVRFDVLAGIPHMYPFVGTTYSATNEALALWGFH